MNKQRKRFFFHATIIQKPSGKPEFIVRSTLSQNALILTQFLSTIYVVVFVFTKEASIYYQKHA